MTENSQPMRLLFICSGNISRSPTAESLMQSSRIYEARSAGLDLMAPRTVDSELLDWADLIFVMSEREEGHASYLRDRYGVPESRIVDLDIPDRYARDNPELVILLKERIGSAIPLDF